MRNLELQETSAERGLLLDAIKATVRQQTEAELELRGQLLTLFETAQLGVQRYVADELAVLLAESSRTTQRWVESAMVLASCPDVAELVRSGRWSMRHADAVTDELLGLSRHLHRQVIDLVLSQRSARTPHELRKATRAAVYLVDPEAAERAAEKAKLDRSVTTHDVRDGSANLLMHGPKAAIAAAIAGLDALCLTPAPEDERTLMQRRFDTLLDLITGRQVAVGGHVNVLVSLATLEGGDQPAEIPGLGFITGTEAREVVAGADEIRRVVTDEAGQLVGVDSQVARPEPTPESDPEPLLSDEVEPDAVHDEAPESTTSDEEWLRDELGHPGFRAMAEWFDHLAPVTGDETPEQARAQVQLRALMAVLIEQELTNGRRVNDAWVRIQDDGTMSIHYPDDPRDPPPHDGGGGGSDPPAPPTQPLPAGYVDDHDAMRVRDAGLDLPHDPREAALVLQRRWFRRKLPSWEITRPAPQPLEHYRPDPTPRDLDWWADHPDTAMAHALIEGAVPLRPTTAAPEGGWPLPRLQPTAWDEQSLKQLVADLLHRPAPSAPTASTAYLFRGQLARFIKTRDQSCRFPGCSRLAVRCDTDHLVPWPLGATTAGNGVSECEHHHKAKHALFNLQRLDGGALRWLLPTGHYADVPPRALLRGW